MMIERAVITDDDLHATIACTGRLGSPNINSASVPETEGGSSSGSTTPPLAAGAAAAHPFNLDACFIGVPANAEGEGR